MKKESACITPISKLSTTSWTLSFLTALCGSYCLSCAVTCFQLVWMADRSLFFLRIHKRIKSALKQIINSWNDACGRIGREDSMLSPCPFSYLNSYPSFHLGTALPHREKPRDPHFFTLTLVHSCHTKCLNQILILKLKAIICSSCQAAQPVLIAKGLVHHQNHHWLPRPNSKFLLSGVMNGPDLSWQKVWLQLMTCVHIFAL